MITLIIRTMFLYILVIFSLRLMGKKQLGELQPSELVTTIIISNIATLSLEESSVPLLAGIMPILAIVCLDVFMSAVTLKFVKVRKIVTGSPRVIISKGEIYQKEMQNLRYTLDDVLVAMREAGIFDISEVKYAIVETTGKISFYQNKETDETVNPPAAVIKDGVFDEAALTEIGLGNDWLEKTLQKEKLTTSEVFLLSADEKGVYRIIKKQ